MSQEAVSKSDVLDILTYYVDETDGRYLTTDTSVNAVLPEIHAELLGFGSDVTVTCTNGTDTLTADSVSSDTYKMSVNDYGNYTVTATDNEITFTDSVTVDAVKIYPVQLAPKRYGYRINKNDSNPATRVEYLYDAEGMTPAHMDFDNGVFDYGDWADLWFVKDNKPLMLTNNGTVAYYLNPNDYTKKVDGENSDVANINFNGNAMAQIPLCWVKRYEDDNYLYEIISATQCDADYKAYAHTDASGNIKPYFYNSLFSAYGNSTILRSISDQYLPKSVNAAQIFTAAQANGAGWHIGSWSQRSLINTFLILIGKSTATRIVFGSGNVCRTTSTPYDSIKKSGTLKDKGQFFGYSGLSQQVKVFHIEAWWGDQFKVIAGSTKNTDNKLYVKMTPEGNGYQVNNVNGYVDVGTLPSSGWIVDMSCNEYGLIPKITGNGSDTTYFTNYITVTTDSVLCFLFAGAYALRSQDYPQSAGALSGQYLSNTFADWQIGCHLSYV